MGGAASSEGGGAAADASRLALLSAAQGEALEKEIQEAGGQRSGASKGAAEETGAGAGGEWVVFYDNRDFALTCRGWWLCERGDSWLLRVPSFGAAPEAGAAGACVGGPCGLSLTGYEELTKEDEILEKVGLVQHAEAYRKGIAKSVERLLERAGVVPFARVLTEKQTMELQCPASALAVGGGSGASGVAGGEEVRLRLTLSRLRLDPKCGEDQAVADLLFDRGAGGREALRATLAHFELFGGSEASACACEAADRELLASLKKRGIQQLVSTKAAFPGVVAYILALRPAHLLKLRRAGVPVTEA